eukprot:gb/GFBE01064147.1/.p1 GENE.gb/GFBE01064147.1/~~gb/GFBE01064147.1/.p1  ORF type:complete len:390 (+),score=108.82 gb/GFBE01064147.1/:1-1170(+)
MDFLYDPTSFTSIVTISVLGLLGLGLLAAGGFAVKEALRGSSSSGGSTGKKAKEPGGDTQDQSDDEEKGQDPVKSQLSTGSGKSDISAAKEAEIEDRSPRGASVRGQHSAGDQYNGTTTSFFKGPAEGGGSSGRQSPETPGQPGSPKPLVSKTEEKDEEENADLPKGKSHHFFVTYEDLHSRLKKRPEKLAKSMLELLRADGLEGFSCGTGLSGKAFQQVQIKMKESCTMLAWFHDETFASETVMLTLQTAMAENIPVLCLVDGDNFGVDAIQHQVELVDDRLMELTWMEYTDASRLSTHDEIKSWIESQIEMAKKTCKTTAPKMVKQLSFSAVMPGLPGSIDEDESESDDDPPVMCFHIMEHNYRPSNTGPKQSSVMKRASLRVSEYQ